MNAISPQIARACQMAAAFIDREVRTRQRLNPHFNPGELWASVTHDARIRIGTPLLRSGQGYYVSHRGHYWKV